MQNIGWLGHADIEEQFAQHVVNGEFEFLVVDEPDE